MNLHSSVIKGTIFLTLSAVLCRIIGFFYKIYISNAIGAENFGIFQLAMPIFGLVSIMCCHCIETSLSKMISENPNDSRQYCICGFTISLILSGICAAILYFASDIIASNFLFESRCSILLKYIAITLLLSIVHSIINGYSFGKMRVLLPAICNITEQISKILITILLVHILLASNCIPDYTTAGKIMLYSELICAIFGITILILSGKKIIVPKNKLPKKSHYKNMIRFLLPISGNRLILCFLGSFESILLPTSLKLYGINSDNSLAIYGILSGMAMSVLMLPQTFTTSLSSLLLPKISSQSTVSYNNNRHKKMSNASDNSSPKALGKTNSDNYINPAAKTASMSIRFCFAMGIFFLAIFKIFGKEIGILLFHNELCGFFIENLSIICPFIYTSTASYSILNGLTKAGYVFFCNITGLVIRLITVSFFVPQYGINAYIYGLFLSHIVSFLMSMLFISLSLKGN